MIRQVPTRNCFLRARKPINSTAENPGQVLQTAGTVIADVTENRLSRGTTRILLKLVTVQCISDSYSIEKEDCQVEDIFGFILNILEELGKCILPTKVKIWYKKQSRRMQVILEAIFDVIILILALCCFGVVVCLVGLLFGLFGLSFEG